MVAQVSAPLRFRTARLDVAPWEAWLDAPEQRLGFVDELTALLTPEATRYLPPSWQIGDEPENMVSWIEARRATSTIASVHLNEADALAGLLITRPRSDNGSRTVGYVLGEAHWGKGYATELVRGFVEWASRNGTTRLEAGVERENAASAAVLRKVGFVPAGLWEDGVDAYALEPLPAVP